MVRHAAQRRDLFVGVFEKNVSWLVVRQHQSPSPSALPSTHIGNKNKFVEMDVCFRALLGVYLICCVWQKNRPGQVGGNQRDEDSWLRIAL